MKSNKAITLIAVIITVIIMLILVAVTINIAMDGELFGKANEAIKQQKIAEDRERLETAKEAERIEGYEDPENEPYPDVDDYFDRLVEEGIINNKDEDVVDNGDDTYEVTTKEEHVFKVTETEDEIIIDYIGEANRLGPTITNIEVKNKTTNSIEIEVIGQRLKDVTYTYEYKKEGESEWKTAGTTEENTHIYTGLEANEIYNIRVKVENKRGSSEKETSVRTGEMTTGKVSFGETIWENGEAKIQVTSSEESYKIEYQINSIEGEWREIANGGEITGLKHGDTVYARLTDGTNTGEYASADIQDKTNPQVTVTAGTTTSNSIAVNVMASDNESGMADSLTYTYYIKTTTGNTYEQKASNGSASYTFTGLTQETTYDIKVEVQGDKAGNKGEGSTQGTTGKVTSGIEQGAITFGSTTWSGNKASVTVNTNTSYTIEYQVNSIAGTWTTIANGGTISGLNHGDTVYARLTDGINAGQYASTSITDGIAPTINSFTVTSADTTSIAVSVSATDNQSGIYSYQFQYKLSTASDYTTATTTVTSNGTCTYTYTGLADNTTYNLRVIVTDKAGKTSNKTATQKTVTANVAPVIATAAYNSKTTNSITITAKATDANGDNLTYTLYTSTSQNGSYTQKATTSASQNATVTLSATSLSNYTTYWWYVEVSDGEATATSNKQSTRTYCPGTGLTCTTTYCPGTQTKTCTTCNGNKTVTKTCTEGATTTCPACEGNIVICSYCGAALEKDDQLKYIYNCPIGQYNHNNVRYYDYHCSSPSCSKSYIIGYCSECKEYVIRNEGYASSCYKCNGTGRTCSHGYTTSHTYEETCTKCNGVGTITSSPCIHGYSSSHRYCSHYTNTTLTSHQYCSHGRTSQHD